MVMAWNEIATKCETKEACEDSSGKLQLINHHLAVQN